MSLFFVCTHCNHSTCLYHHSTCPLYSLNPLCIWIISPLVRPLNVDHSFNCTFIATSMIEFLHTTNAGYHWQHKIIGIVESKEMARPSIIMSAWLQCIACVYLEDTWSLSSVSEAFLCHLIQTFVVSFAWHFPCNWGNKLTTWSGGG